MPNSSTSSSLNRPCILVSPVDHDHSQSDDVSHQEPGSIRRKPSSRARIKDRFLRRSFESRRNGPPILCSPNPSYDKEFKEEKTTTVSVPVTGCSDNRSVFASERRDSLENPHVQKLLQAALEICHSYEYDDGPQAARESMQTLVDDTNIKITTDWEKQVNDGTLSPGSTRIQVQLLPALDLDITDTMGDMRGAPGSLQRNPYGLFELGAERQAALKKSVIEWATNAPKGVKLGIRSGCV